MDAPSTTSASTKAHNLFQVYLRLRPPQAGAANAERFLAVEPPATDAASTAPTHITLNPPNDRRRAIEKFCFTQVFEEDATQLDVFHCTGVVPLVEGVLAPHGGEGTDALLATLGVTGSGKTHTILGSRSQRGMTQLALDVVFRSLGQNIVDCNVTPSLEASINASDASEATVFSAQAFLETVYADLSGPSRPSSRAPTPMIVRSPNTSSLSQRRPEEDSLACSSISGLDLPGAFPRSPKVQRTPKSVRIVRREDYTASSPYSPSTPTKMRLPLAISRGNTLSLKAPVTLPQMQGTMSASKTPGKHFMTSTVSTKLRDRSTKTSPVKGDYPSSAPPPTPRRLLTRPSALPSHPDVSGVNVSSDPAAEYAVLISMYEVYNDRIFDLLTPPIKSAATKEYRRRPLLFKSTELSTDRKVVAGLRKIICSNLGQALMVLEAGLHERRVAGTGSNSVSSRSHGFFCVEVKKRHKGRRNEHMPWGGNTLTIVDLAGSERARDAKTAGATLAEAGKINESLMYLGQCLQMQSDSGTSNKPNVVPFRQCKLTELLFSNSFPSAALTQSHAARRNPQKAVMIVTADPHGDFNATSQILRYSALAREITVPRIPSITQTILANSAVANPVPVSNQGPCSSPILSPPLHHRPFFPPGSTGGSFSTNVQRTFSPCSNASSEDRVTMEIAALEIARLSEELEYLRSSLEQETERRHEAESHLLSMNDRLLELEQEIREDCVAEFEQRLAVELARWKTSLELEKERGEEHWDRKVDVLERLQITITNPTNGGDADGENDDKENLLVENLEEENSRLRRELLVLKRELTARSPVKRKPLQERDDLPSSPSAESGVGGAMMVSPRTSRMTGDNHNNNYNNHNNSTTSISRKMERLRVTEDNAGRGSSTSTRSASGAGSPKKIRKLTARKWDVAMDEDDLF